ncbi:putative nuclease HARBI1 [Dreissena polymorpha]|uniref:putative nuclease HARBI1 n=1 Tax=Dreissena polymorpha TaxID=45954 RepID=UPI002264ECA7|nr:putative nuclease HARBI1 [Dreissena polymorpha]
MLHYLASGEFQINDGDHHQVSQSTVSKVISEVLQELTSSDMVREHIRFPTSVHDRDAQVAQFAGVANFPKVMGVIDCTHVRILVPSLEEDIYVNRKGFHSITAQLVFDAFDTIIDVVARWPGSSHDSQILQNSGVKQLFEEGIIPVGYHLLGDSGYPSRRWLLTPYANLQAGQQTRYNR